MKYLQQTLAVLLLLTIAMTAAAQTKYSTVKIAPPQDRQQRAELLGLLEIDHFAMKDGFIIAEINQQQIASLRQTSFQYEIVIPDVAKHIQQVNERYLAASPNARAAMEQPGGTIGNLIPTPGAFQVQSTL